MEKVSMAAVILDTLRSEIVNSRFPEHGLITEGEISLRFGVSKTPAREALNILCQEGLLEKLPHRGYLIKSFTHKQLRDLFQFRCILETSAIKVSIQTAGDAQIEQVRQVAKRRVAESEAEQFIKYNKLNYDFHVALAQLSGNSLLSDSLKQVLNQLNRALAQDWKNTDVNTLLSAHEAIVEAVAARDGDLAIRLIMREVTDAEGRINPMDHNILI